MEQSIIRFFLIISQMDNMQKIPVFFTFDANYLLAAKVAIHSMNEHSLTAILV